MTAIAVPVNTVFGIVCGLAIVRKRFPGRGLVNAFVDLPLALSPVIVGLSLVLLYGANGWFGFLPEHGYQVLFATPAIVLATIFVSLPFVAREVIPTLREIGDDQEQAAATLGASGWQTFWRITLPSIKWAVIYGVVLTTARCFGEYGAVLVVSGNIEGKTQTATLRVDDAAQFALRQLRRRLRHLARARRDGDHRPAHHAPRPTERTLAPDVDRRSQRQQAVRNVRRARRRLDRGARRGR